MIKTNATNATEMMRAWNNQAKRDHEARLREIADEATPRQPSRVGRALAFLGFCAVCFVPAAIVGYANGGFDAAQAATAPARVRAPKAAPKTSSVVVLNEVEIMAAKAAKRGPRRIAPKRCFDHELVQGGSPTAPTVRVCTR